MYSQIFFIIISSHHHHHRPCSPAQAQNSASTLATTFLTGHGCAHNNTNATWTSSSSSSRTRAFFSTKRQTPKKNHLRKRGESDGVERVEKSQHGTTSSGVPVPGNRENPQRALGKEPRREDYQLRDRRYDGTVLRAKNDDQKRSFFFRCCLSILSFRLRVAKSV